MNIQYINIYLFLRVFICPEHYHCCQWLSVLFIRFLFCFVLSFVLLPCVFNESTWWEWLSSRLSSLLQCLMIVFFLWWIIRSLFFQYAPQDKKKKQKTVNICIIHGTPARAVLNMYIWELVSWLNKRWSSVVYLNLRASLETSFRCVLEPPPLPRLKVWTGVWGCKTGVILQANTHAHTLPAVFDVW